MPSMLTNLGSSVCTIAKPGAWHINWISRRMCYGNYILPILQKVCLTMEGIWLSYKASSESNACSLYYTSLTLEWKKRWSSQVLWILKEFSQVLCSYRLPTFNIIITASLCVHVEWHGMDRQSYQHYNLLLVWHLNSLDAKTGAEVWLDPKFLSDPLLSWFSFFWLVDCKSQSELSFSKTWCSAELSLRRYYIGILC